MLEPFLEHLAPDLVRASHCILCLLTYKIMSLLGYSCMNVLSLKCPIDKVMPYQYTRVNHFVNTVGTNCTPELLALYQKVEADVVDMNTGYVAYRLLQLCDQQFDHKLRTHAKLVEHDDRWKAVCARLGWPVLP